MIILGIESSCDETAASIVADGTTVLSNVVNSQIEIHSKYGGVIPEVAARSHLEVINPVIDQALEEANLTWDDIDAIAVTYAPGLIGSLLIGSLAARTLAVTKDKPLYGVHHILAHFYANFLDKAEPEFPCLALIVSGGHTQLVLFESHTNFKLLGKTQDDAVGEAFDKVAKVIGLPYPGGPSIAMTALHGNPNRFKFPKPKTDNPLDFSYSGLKTAVLRQAQKQIGKDFTFPSFEIRTVWFAKPTICPVSSTFFIGFSTVSLLSVLMILNISINGFPSTFSSFTPHNCSAIGFIFAISPFTSVEITPSPMDCKVMDSNSSCSCNSLFVVSSSAIFCFKYTTAVPFSASCFALKTSIFDTLNSCSLVIMGTSSNAVIKSSTFAPISLAYRSIRVLSSSGVRTCPMIQLATGTPCTIIWVLDSMSPTLVQVCTEGRELL